MVALKILKRKDASSVVVAVAVAIIISQLLPAVTGRLAANLSSVTDGQAFTGAYPGAGWHEQYLFPLVWAALQLVALEVLCWLYVGASMAVQKKR